MSIIYLVREHDCSGTNMVQQIVSGLAIMALPGGQSQSDREALPVGDRVDFGREAASGATETVISIPLFTVAALLVGANRSAVDHLDIAIVRGGDGVHHPVPQPAFRHRTKRL